MPSRATYPQEIPPSHPQLSIPLYDGVSYEILARETGGRLRINSILLRLRPAEFGFSTPEHPSHGFEVAVPVDRVRK